MVKKKYFHKEKRGETIGDVNPKFDISDFSRDSVLKSSTRKDSCYDLLHECVLSVSVLEKDSELPVVLVGFY